MACLSDNISEAIVAYLWLVVKKLEVYISLRSDAGWEK